MKVENGAAQQVAAQQAYASSAARGAQESARVTPQSPAGASDVAAPKTRGGDSVAISAQGRLRAQALDAVRSTPEARSKLVMELRSQIKMGTYKVDDNKLAGHIASQIDLRA